MSDSVSHSVDQEGISPWCQTQSVTQSIRRASVRDARLSQSLSRSGGHQSVMSDSVSHSVDQEGISPFVWNNTPSVSCPHLHWPRVPPFARLPTWNDTNNGYLERLTRRGPKRLQILYIPYIFWQQRFNAHNTPSLFPLTYIHPPPLPPPPHPPILHTLVPQGKWGLRKGFGKEKGFKICLKELT